MRLVNPHHPYDKEVLKNKFVMNGRNIKREKSVAQSTLTFCCIIQNPYHPNQLFTFLFNNYEMKPHLAIGYSKQLCDLP